MFTPLTLTDFVATLLRDPATMSGFESDPTATLAQAGLQDITPQDVQEVLPLVLDYAPNGGLPALEAGLTDLPSGPEGAIAYLQAVVAAAPAGEVTPPAASDGMSGTLMANGDGDLDGFTGDLNSTSAIGDLAGNTWGSADSLGVIGSLNSELGSGVGGIRTDMESVEGGLIGTTPIGAVAGTAGLYADHATAEFELANTEMGFESEHCFTEGGLPAGVHVSGGAASALGTFTGSGSGHLWDPELTADTSGEPNLDLEPNALAEGGQAASGAMAAFVSSGGASLANEISSGGDQLGAFLTGGADVLATEIDDGSETMAGFVASGSATAAGEIDAAPTALSSPGLDAPSPSDLRSELPATGGLPGAGDLPAAGLPMGTDALPGGAGSLPTPGDLPDAGSLPSAGGLPGGAGLPTPGDLPDAGSLPSAGLPDAGSLPGAGDLPGAGNLPDAGSLPSAGDLPASGLPSGTPDLPVENPLPAAELPSTNGLDDAVTQSPVGNPVPMDAPAAPSVGGATDDVSLG